MKPNDTDMLAACDPALPRHPPRRHQVAALDGVAMIDIRHRSFDETLLACEALGGVDLIVTSPPYPDARPGQYGGDASHDFTWPDYQRLGDHVARALKPGGFAAINIDGPVRFWRSKKIGSERSLIAFKLAIDWAERVGLRYVEHCAYVRDGAPGLFGDRWRSGWEPVHVFQRPGAAGHFDVKGLQLPAIQAGMVHGHSRSRSADGFRGNLKGIITAATKGLTTAVQGFINCGTTDQSHPAPFGQWLADAFVLCYSPPGGLVCDPFMGSGTVALSCARNGRNIIGGDLGARETDGKRWADIARERADAIAGARAAELDRSVGSPLAPGIACDPFMGSGTSAVACAMLGRSVIGGDIGARETDGKRWADIARENADAIANPAQRALFA